MQSIWKMIGGKASFESFVSFYSWFVGPDIQLQDCLAAFFTNDELKGIVVNVAAPMIIYKHLFSIYFIIHSHPVGEVMIGMDFQTYKMLILLNHF